MGVITQVIIARYRQSKFRSNQLSGHELWCSWTNTVSWEVDKLVHMHAIYTSYNYTEEMVKPSLINLPVLDFLEPVPKLYGEEDEGFVPESNYHVCAPPHNEHIAICNLN